MYDDWYTRLVLLFVSFKERCVKMGYNGDFGVQNGSKLFGFLLSFQRDQLLRISCWAGIKLEFPPGHSPIGKAFFSWLVRFDSCLIPPISLVASGKELFSG